MELKKNDLIIVICKDTKKSILASYEGNNKFLCLHDDTRKEELNNIKEFLK